MSMMVPMAMDGHVWPFDNEMDDWHVSWLRWWCDSSSEVVDLVLRVVLK